LTAFFKWSISVFFVGLFCIYFLVSILPTISNQKTIPISTTNEHPVDIKESIVQSKSITSDIVNMEVDKNDDLISSATDEVDELQPISEPKSLQKEEKLLDVPLLKQMDPPRLYNGCEVTSLAMLLQFDGLSVTKNELATKITRVPLNYQDGKKGNPNEGFVGNMEDGPGLGVYHEPIFKLAQSYVNDRAEDLTKQPFSVVIEKLAAGTPVWVIITSSFAPTSEIKTWKTPQGPVEVTFKMHSVVITGYDQESIYINDPYGGKNKKVNKDNFIKAWEQMGSQAIVINKIGISRHNLLKE
jgi:uncharacterized protein YvpB